LPSLLQNVERIPLGQVALYPGNARRGDVAAIAASLEENQQVAPLVVQRSTGYVLGGNHTLLAARSLGWTEIDVVYVDVDDQRASKVNLALNRSFELGDGYDDDLLLAQLQGLDDLDGTGWAEDDLQEFRRATGQLGDEAAAFLDGFTSPPPFPPSPPPAPPGAPAGQQPPVPPAAGPPPAPAAGGPPPAPQPPPAEWVQCAWTVHPSSRDVIRRAVALAQQHAGVQTAAEGLHAMAAHYLATFEQQGTE
jgi:hypothetical protein